jgi:hypothetical protein
MYCRKCGVQIPDDSRFCVQCGTALNAQETGNPPQGNAAGIRKHKVTVFRESQIYLVNPPVNISINNQKRSSVDNGGTAVFELDEGHYVFTFSLSFRSRKVELDVTRDMQINLKWDRLTGALKTDVIYT